MDIKVRGVKVYRSRGNVYAYHRRTGKRITAPIGSAAFVAEVERLNEIVPPAAKSGSLGALIAAYRASPEFIELAPRTRADYLKVFDYLRPLEHDALVLVNTAYVIEVRDAAFVKHKRRFANYVVAVLRLVLRWGVVRDLVDQNVAAGVPKLRRPRNAPTANRAWSDEECERVFAAAAGGVRVAVGLGMFAAMREGDAVRLPRSAYDGSWLRWRQGKTGALVELPAHPALRQVLDEIKTTGDVEAMTLVAGERGRPYTLDGFRTMFFRLIKSLEAEGQVDAGLTFHGLRHTAGRILGDQGVDPRTIAALLGHKTLAMTAHYSEASDRKKRGAIAVAKLRPRRK